MQKPASMHGTDEMNNMQHATYLPHLQQSCSAAQLLCWALVCSPGTPAFILEYLTESVLWACVLFLLLPLGAILLHVLGVVGVIAQAGKRDWEDDFEVALGNVRALQRAALQGLQAVLLELVLALGSTPAVELRKVAIYLQYSVPLEASNTNNATTTDLVADSRSVLVAFSDGTCQLFSWAAQVGEPGCLAPCMPCCMCRCGPWLGS